jgi:hypothetical protein
LQQTKALDFEWTMQNFKRLATNQDRNEIQKYFGFSLFRGQSYELDPMHFNPRPSLDLSTHLSWNISYISSYISSFPSIPDDSIDVTNDEEINPPQSQSPNTSIAVPSLAGHSFYGQSQVSL